MLSQLYNILVKQETPSLDAMLEGADKHLNNFDTLVEPAPNASPRTSFDSGLPKEEISMVNLKPAERLRVMKRALPLFANMNAGARMYDGNFKPKKAEASPEFLSELERRAKELGAKNVAYVKVPQDAIFKAKGVPHEYALVFTVEMDKEPINTAPSLDCQLEVMDGYKNMAIISKKLARFMRAEGFAAYPGTALGGVTDYVHLAELAGLGAIGYHGLLISPDEGARLRINTIYTNITNLPIKTSSENEHLWVRDFCAMCKKCVRSCPVDAIYDTPQPRGNGGMQCIEHKTCRDYFSRNYGCAVCLKVCPFSQVGYEKIKAGFKGNEAAPQFRIGLELA